MNLKETSEKLAKVDWNKAVNEGSINRIGLNLNESKKPEQKKQSADLSEGFKNNNKLFD